MNTDYNNPSKIDTVILAGGLGTRLRPKLNNKPKCLAIINGKPFIDILLDNCIAQGLKRFINVFFLCSLYYFFGRLLENVFFYQIFEKIYIEEKDYFSIILLIVSILSIILINKFNNTKLFNLFK